MSGTRAVSVNFGGLSEHSPSPPPRCEAAARTMPRSAAATESPSGRVPVQGDQGESPSPGPAAKPGLEPSSGDSDGADDLESPGRWGAPPKGEGGQGGMQGNRFRVKSDQPRRRSVSHLGLGSGGEVSPM